MKFDPNNIPKEPLSELFKGENAVLEALHFITHNNLRIEHRRSLEDENWKECDLRKMIFYSVGKGFQAKEPAKIQNYLAWYRIKQPNFHDLVDQQILIPREQRLRI